MLTIRLSRIGKKKKPMYRLIISEKARDPYGRALEILGSYNPFTKDLQVKKDRIEYWLSQGSGMSATANNLLVGKNIIKGEKIKASKVGKKKKDKGKDKKEAKSPDVKTIEGKSEEKKETEVKSEEKKEDLKKETAPTEEKKPTEDLSTSSGQEKKEKPAEEEKK